MIRCQMADQKMTRQVTRVETESAEERAPKMMMMMMVYIWYVKRQPYLNLAATWQDILGSCDIRFPVCLLGTWAEEAGHPAQGILDMG